jgi:predicted  nucleic acid-binding Zn-ribbon protein
MSLEKEIDKTGKNVRDTINEVKHRTEAETEKLNRESDPTMSQGERARSALNETKHNIQADIDKGKRDIRSKT